MSDTQHDRADIENTIPVLAVNDVTAAIRFYREMLGFKLDWSGSADPPQIASVSRDGHAIMLQRREPVTPGCVWIGIAGLASLWESVRANPNVVVVQRPTNQPWALEMKLRDPDGNILWFGTESLPDLPFGQQAFEGRLEN
jgi:catechol 2,3-dioxygenase-like lactoylglutathione lyase family enzyme